MNEVRLLHIVGASNFGGAAKLILRLSQKMKAEGWHVDVMTTDPIFQRTARQQGVGVIALDVIRRELRPWWDLRGLIRLYCFLRREHYLVVHTHTSKAGFVGRLAAWLAGVPVILHTVHGFAFHEQTPFTVRTFYSALERLASSWCDRIVAVTEFHRRRTVELGICEAENIIAIPNGIADPGPGSSDAVREILRKWKVQPGELILLTAGRLAREKGIEDLIEAAAILRRTGRAFRVVLAGDGPLRARLNALAENRGVADRVIFLGYREDVADLLGACDLVVLPSVREGLSIALLEAMAAGKPIVTTRIGGNMAVVSQEDSALLVPPVDPKALSYAILRCWRDPALGSRLGKRARQLFEESYTEDRMLDGYRGVYFDLVRAKCSGAPGSNRSTFRGNEPPRAVRLMTPTRSVHCSQPDVGDKDDGLIRPARREDLQDIVAVHNSAFINSFLTMLGFEFLRLYYALVLCYPGGILLVKERNARVEGFACGFVVPDGFYKLLSQTKRSFLLPVLLALVRRPWLAGNIFRGVQRVERQTETPGMCELSSLAVRPDLIGRGTGKALVNAFVKRACTMGARHIVLHTDADDNKAANVFYRKLGFQLNRYFQRQKGRWMNEYVIDLPSGADV